MSLEVTPMTKSFKMLVLLGMIAEGAFPGTVSIERLMDRVRQLGRRSAAIRTELGDAIDDPVKLRELLEQNPIVSWTGGRGTGGDSYFSYDGQHFATTFAVRPALKEAAESLARELADWRLAVYVRRTGMTDGAPRILCKVTHAGGTPILMLPSRDRNPGIPEGWTPVMANGETFQANFVKIAVNVMHRDAPDRNVLAEVLRGWFGPRAGLPGTTHQVVFTREQEGYRLEPRRSEELRGPQLWAKYKRADVPKLFGFDFKGMESQSGVVTRPGLMLLFVTLDKSKMQKEHQFEDRFLSPTEFQWQSQNRTKRDSRPGREIAEHRALGIHVHLFARATAKVRGETQPFAYAGELEFQRWEGDNPITVWWGLMAEVPRGEWGAVKLPAT